MLIVLHPDVTPQAQATIEGRVRELGFTPHAISGAGRTAIGITGNKGPIDPGHFRESSRNNCCFNHAGLYR